jgi:hypothetical protein
MFVGCKIKFDKNYKDAVQREIDAAYNDKYSEPDELYIWDLENLLEDEDTHTIIKIEGKYVLIEEYDYMFPKEWFYLTSKF